MVKNPPANKWVQSLVWEDPLKQKLAVIFSQSIFSCAPKSSTLKNILIIKRWSSGIKIKLKSWLFLLPAMTPLLKPENRILHLISWAKDKDRLSRPVSSLTSLSPCHRPITDNTDIFMLTTASTQARTTLSSSD